MNYEITAELIGKNILEQIVKNVKFEKVDKNLIVGNGNNFDVNLTISDEGSIHLNPLFTSINYTKTHKRC